MSKLFYDITIEEEYIGTNSEYKIITKNIPHFEEIKNWLPKEWDRCKIHTTFDGQLKNKVQNTLMKCFEEKDGTAIARITIEFVPGFRLSKNRRDACWQQLDAQMSDGFGESYDHTQIPNSEQGWVLCFQIQMYSKQDIEQDVINIVAKTAKSSIF